MKLADLLNMVMRAAMETVMRHLPRLLARRNGKTSAPQPSDRATAEKIRTLQRILRRLR